MHVWDLVSQEVGMSGLVGQKVGRRHLPETGRCGDPRRTKA